ncbi:PKD domain-containing protein, partial [Salegentibacter salinarum]
MKKTTSLKTPVLFFLCLLFFSLNVLAQTTYTFSNLGPSNGDFKSISTLPTNINIQISDNFEFVPFVLYPTASGTGSTTFTIKGDGINLGSFDVEDMTWGLFSSEYTLDNTTKVVFHKTDGTTVTWNSLSSLFQQRYSYDTNDHSILSIFSAAGRVSEVEKIEITVDFKDGGDINKFEIRNISLSNLQVPSLATVAIVTTSSISSVTATGTTISGNVTDDGGDAVTERGFVYGTSSNPTTSDTKVQSGIGTGSFSEDISGLKPETTYYVRAYAINGQGTSYGDEESFTTKSEGVLLSSNPTLIFTENSADITGDNIASDGEGSSQTISDIDIQIFNISDELGTFVNSLTWKDNDFLYSADPNYSGLTYDNNNEAIKGMAINSADGSEFRLVKFTYYNWGETNSFTNTIKGYRNGSEVASMTFDGFDSNYNPITVALDASFSSVDDVRIYISDAGWTGNGTTNHSINKIALDAPVSNSAPADIALSTNTLNQSEEENATVGTLSTTDADGGDTHTYSLVLGTGDTDNANFNINGSDLRANDASTLAAGNYSVRIQTSDGTDTYAEAFTITVLDDVAPVFTNSTPSVSGTTVSQTTLTVQLDEIGTAYYIVVAEGDSAPSSAQVKAGQNNSGSSALTNGSINVNAASEHFSVDITGLSSSTDYDIYVTAEDDEETPNLQGSPEKIDVTTNNTVPTFTDLADTVETTNEDTSVEVSFLSIAAQSDANDADGTVIAYVVKSVNSGSLTINGTAYAAGTNDQITPAQNANWTPNANANGTLNAFTITAKDNAGAQSSPAVQAKVAVTAVNDDPTITGLPSSVTITEDATEDAFDISAATISDIDAEGEKLTLTLEATGGVFDIAAGTGITSTGHLSNLLSLTGKLTDLNNYISTSTNIYFRPNTNLSGNAAASVEVSINDNGNTGSGLGTDVYSGSVSVNIIGVNDAPVAVDDNYDLDENTPQTGNVLTNDSDPEGDALTASLVTPPENGTVVLNANGSFTYTPNTNYSGLDNLIYRVCDNGTPSLCNTATVNFEIEEVAASVSSVLVPANATYTTGQNLDFTVNFDKPIVVDTGGGTPSLSLEVGGSTKNASYISGSGSSALVFRYTIQNGDEDPNGIQVSSLSLNGGTFTSGSGTAANLTLNGIGSTAAVLVDALAPTGYTVSIDQNPINSISANAVSFTFAGGEVNTNYNYTFSSAGGGTNVTGSGTLTSATHQISGIDLSALADGSITLSVSLTDAIGNAGSVVTDITSKDTSVPTGYTVELNLLGESMINSVNVEEVKFSASGLETGSTLYYSFASDGGGSTVSGTETITSATENFDNSGVGYDLSGLADGTITLSVYLMDIAGNEGANATTSEIKDTTAPTGYVVTWDDAFINAFESSNTSFTISNAEISTTANYSISSSGDSNMATISNSQLINSTAQQIPLDVSGLADGILTIEITLTDEGDNEGTLVSTNNTILDQTPPASPSIPDLSAASDTGASNTDNNTADQTPTFTGTAEANTSVEIFSEGSSLGTTTTDGSGNWSFTSPILTDGTYAITATATDAAGNVSANSSGLPIIIDQNECNAQANFSLNPNAGCETPLTVFFTDQSTLPDSWYWEFGDGNTSTAQNPIHSYTTYGVFTVKLTVTDTISGCSSSTEKVITNYKLSSDFTSNTTFGCGPLTVDFADSSVGAESWNWDFGDGTTSTEQNPSHTYTQPGTYTVALTTEGGSCSKTNTKTSYIQVIGPDVDFSSDITEGCGPLTVAFTNNTIAGSPAIGWLWDFGDGSTSTQQNPAHEYTAEGIYTVSLTVSDLDGCSRTLTKTDLIEVNMLEAELISTNVTCTGGSDGTITANSDVGLAPFTYEWSNGAATAEISGLSPGNYSVEITDANGCSVKKSVEITEPLPADLVTSNPSAVSYSSAELGGELLNAFDCEQETGIVYATTSNPDITDIKLEMIQTGHQFNENVTGLQLNTTYYVRAYSTNVNGVTTYGNEVTFTTSKKTLEIIADVDQNKIYGETDPTLTYTATGFENGDDASILSGSLTREPGEAVGTYAIGLGSLSAGANYTIDFTGADLTIGTKVLSVTADTSQGKVYGDADPEFTYTATGFENGDDASILSGSLTREPGEAVGTYVIQLGSLSAGVNYTIDFTGADFTIGTKVLSVTADPGQNKVYGEADPEFTYTA